MKTEAQQFQANMITKGVFTRRERREIKYLSPGNRDQHRVVREALPQNHIARRWMETCGETDSWDNIDYCGVPLCPRCHMRVRGVQTAIAVKKIFVGATNEELAFATILLPTQLDFSGMTDLVENEKRRLRTFVDRQRKKDARWDDFHLLGWWEVDRMSFGDFDTCGRNTRIALEALGFPLLETPNKTIWRPHLHAIVRKGRLTTDEIANALRKETHQAKYQVDIQSFKENRDVGDNIQNIVRYCLKFRIECDYKRPNAQDFIEAEEAKQVQCAERNWWPAEDIRDYVDWLCVGRSGFQSLRFVIGNAKSRTVNDVQVASSSGVSVAQEIANGNASVNSISDRCDAQRDADEFKAHAVVSDMNGTFAVEDGRVVSSNVVDVAAMDTGVTRCMYNNTIQDTNWTDNGAGMISDVLDAEDHPIDAAPMSKTSRYAGNVVPIAERLRSTVVLNRANGDQRSCPAH